MITAEIQPKLSYACSFGERGDCYFLNGRNIKRFVTCRTNSVRFSFLFFFFAKEEYCVPISGVLSRRWSWLSFRAFDFLFQLEWVNVTFFVTIKALWKNALFLCYVTIATEKKNSSNLKKSWVQFIEEKPNPAHLTWHNWMANFFVFFSEIWN